MVFTEMRPMVPGCANGSPVPIANASSSVVQPQNTRERITNATRCLKQKKKKKPAPCQGSTILLQFDIAAAQQLEYVQLTCIYD